MNETVKVVEQEVRETTAQEAIRYLTNRKDEPLFQIVGEYIRAAEEGAFDKKRVSNLIQKHFQKLTAAEFANKPKGNEEQDISRFFKKIGVLGYISQVKIQELEKAFNELPVNIINFLKQYSEGLDEKIKNEYATALQNADNFRIRQQLITLLGEDKAGERTLSESEKDLQVKQEFSFLAGRPMAGSLDKTNPIYKRAVKRAEFSSTPTLLKNEKDVPLSKIKAFYISEAKKIYDAIQSKVDRKYDPQQTNIHEKKVDFSDFYLEIEDQSGVRRFSIMDLERSLITLQTSGSLFIEYETRLDLLNYFHSYINSEQDSEWRTTLNQLILEIKNNPSEVFTAYQNIKQDSPRHLFAKIIGWTHRLENLSLEVKDTSNTEGFFGTARNSIELVSKLIQKLRNEEAEKKVFSDTDDVSKELEGLTDYLKDLVNTVVVMTGNPFHILRFPKVVSYFEVRKINFPDNFINYQEFSQDLDLSSKTIVRNKMYVAPQEKDSKHVYLVLPQYAPIAHISVSVRTEAMGEVELICGEDFELEYEKKTGHYRVSLLSERAILGAKKGLKYIAGLDFLEKQKEIPRKTNTIPLSTQKLDSLCDTLKIAGFERLAEKLRTTLKPTLLKRVKLSLKGQAFQYSSGEVARAVRNSIYYSFETLESEELRIASETVGEAVEGELDFSFLPNVAVGKERSARIKVQCRHVAKLYSLILNYLSTDEVATQTFDSSLFVDPTEGISSLLGVRFFTMGHSDTRGVSTDLAGESTRFQQDLTPNPSVGTVVDAVRSSFLDLKKLAKKLLEMRKSLDGNLSFSERFYIELNASPKDFSEYILQLKKEAAESSDIFEDRVNKIGAFVQAEPGLFRRPNELAEVMKKKPLAAVTNILLFLQEQGNAYVEKPEEIEQVKSVLFTLMEWFQKVREKQMTIDSIPTQERDFFRQLSSASRIAEKLLLLLDHAQDGNVEDRNTFR